MNFVIHRHNSKVGDLRFTSWAVLSSGRCQELPEPAEPALGTVPVHCSDTCLPSALPKLGCRAHLTTHQPCQLPFQVVYKVISHGDTRNSGERKNPSISVTENMGYWKIHCTAPQWFRVYWVLQLGFFPRN